MKIQIYPGDNYRLIYNLYPLLSGYVALPPLQLKCVGSKLMMDQLNQTVMGEILSHYLPTHIYVLVSQILFQVSFVALCFDFHVLLFQPQMKAKRTMLTSAEK